MNIDANKIKIETKRLFIRAWSEADLVDFNEYAKIPGQGEQAGWKHHESMEESEKILKQFIEKKDVLALVDKETLKVIGSMGIHNTNSNLTDLHQGKIVKEIGYVVALSAQNKGIATEALRAIIAYCFEQLAIDYLFCSHYPSNLKSKRVMEKCGFTYYETRPKESAFIGLDDVVVVNQLSKEQYFKAKSDIN